MSDSWTKRGWACVKRTEQGLPITASYIKRNCSRAAGGEPGST